MPLGQSDGGSFSVESLSCRYTQAWVRLTKATPHAHFVEWYGHSHVCGVPHRCWASAVSGQGLSGHYS